MTALLRVRYELMCDLLERFPLSKRSMDRCQIMLDELGEAQHYEACQRLLALMQLNRLLFSDSQATTPSA